MYFIGFFFFTLDNSFHLMEIMIFLIQSTVIIIDFPSVCTARNFLVGSVVTHEALDYLVFALFCFFFGGEVT